MPLLSTLLCSGASLLITYTAIAQSPIYNTKVNRVIGKQLQEQQQWNFKDIPRNSVLYQSEGMRKISGNYYSKSSKDLPIIRLSDIRMLQSLTSENGSNLFSLKTYISEARGQMIWQDKNSWWRDPKKGIGAEALRGIVTPVVFRDK